MENRIVPNRKQCNSCVHKSAIQDPAMEVDAYHYYCSASPGDGPEGECIDGYYWDSGVCLCYKEKPRDLANAAGFEEKEGEVFFVGGGITGLFWQKGIMDFSAAEGVCILKRAAERLARQAAGSGV